VGHHRPRLYGGRARGDHMSCVHRGADGHWPRRLAFGVGWAVLATCVLSSGAGRKSHWTEAVGLNRPNPVPLFILFSDSFPN
jgi:hypothetical protein